MRPDKQDTAGRLSPVRRLDMSHLPRILALQEKVMAHPEGGDFVIRRSAEDFTEYLTDHIVLGIFDGEDLVAQGVSILIIPGKTVNTYEIAEPWRKHSSVPNMITLLAAAVDPAYRGLGLQRKLLRGALETAPEGRNYLFAYCLPDNLFSMRNILAEGFVIAEAYRKPDGSFNLYGCVRHTSYTPEYSPITAEVDLSAEGAFEAVENLLAQGMTGHAYREDGTAKIVGFSRYTGK